jgi:polysaccharide deacetylase family protein (PEP-CTERM system associated)
MKPISERESIFTVDVEDWFHILDVPSTPALSAWDGLPSHVERNFYQLLDLFAEHNVKTTCFFLGWVGERFPHLVKRAVAEGHEIASHGYAHRLVYELGRERFYEDALRARKLLEDVAGERVLGYRSAGFSVRPDTLWFLDALSEAGYQYDSSVFPAQSGHGGIAASPREPHRIGKNTTSMVEFPISVADVLGKPVCFFGGGYLRLFPYWLIRRMSEQVLAAERPVIYYIHPREIDPNHPRLPMSAHRKFKSYVNLDTTAPKLTNLFRDFRFITFRDYLARNASSLQAAGA